MNEVPKVQIPAHACFYRVRGDQIVEIRPEPVPGGVPRGIREQIGVPVPPLPAFGAKFDALREARQQARLRHQRDEVRQIVAKMEAAGRHGSNCTHRDRPF